MLLSNLCYHCAYSISILFTVSSILYFDLVHSFLNSLFLSCTHCPQIFFFLEHCILKFLFLSWTLYPQISISIVYTVSSNFYFWLEHCIVKFLFLTCTFCPQISISFLYTTSSNFYFYPLWLRDSERKFIISQTQEFDALCGIGWFKK